MATLIAVMPHAAAERLSREWRCFRVTGHTATMLREFACIDKAVAAGRKLRCVWGVETGWRS